MTNSNRFYSEPEDDEQSKKRKQGFRFQDSYDSGFQVDRIFKNTVKAVKANRQTYNNKLRADFEDITSTEAAKFGFSEDARQKMNQVRAMKRQQFYASRGIKHNE